MHPIFSTERLQIVVVDDQAMSRLLLCSQLNALGHSTIELETPAAVLELMRTLRVDAVITDCNMPDMNGYELSRHIRHFEQENGLKPILVFGHTANTGPGEIQRCLNAGMNDCIFKPTDTDRLATLINKGRLKKSAPSAIEPTPQGSAHCYDENFLDALTRNNAKLKENLFKEFFSSSTNDIRQLEIALNDGSELEVGRIVHRLKGSSRMIGAHNLITAIKRYEERARHSASAQERRLLAQDILAAARLAQTEVNRRLQSWPTALDQHLEQAAAPHSDTENGRGA